MGSTVSFLVSLTHDPHIALQQLIFPVHKKVSYSQEFQYSAYTSFPYIYGYTSFGCQKLQSLCSRQRLGNGLAYRICGSGTTDYMLLFELLMVRCSSLQSAHCSVSLCMNAH